MDAYRDEPRRPESWLLETIDAAQSHFAAVSSRSEFGSGLPTALAEPAETKAVNVVRPARESSDLEIRVSTQSIPEPVSVSLADSPANRAIQNEDPVVTESEASPVYRQLREQDGVARAETTISLPLANARRRGVLQIHTTIVTNALDSEQFDSLQRVIDWGFQILECHRQLDHERERLEQFRSLISHDLGTPLNLAAGRLDLARQEVETDHLDHIEGALQRLDALVDEGLTFVNVGRPVDEPTTVDLEEIGPECWQFLDTAEQDELVVEPVTVFGDSQRIRMILDHLLENAIVHTDGAVTVSVGHLEEGGFYVEDDGRGIPDEVSEFVFDRGYTTVEDRDGRGLAIVQEIAAVHGWDVGLGDGSGTRVEIRTEAW